MDNENLNYAAPESHVHKKHKTELKVVPNHDGE